MTDPAPSPPSSHYHLEKTRFVAGVWTGRLTSSVPATAPPDLSLLQDGTEGAPPQVTAVAGACDTWEVQVEIPATALSEGVSVFLIADRTCGAVLARLPILAGEALADDLRGEVALLRAELDQLRGAFQSAMRSRHDPD